MTLVPRLDGRFVDAFQHFYDATWDRMAVPIGHFRMALACAPVCVDTGLDLGQGRGAQTLANVLFDLVVLCLLYGPWRMVSDNHLQERGALSSLNAEARSWALRTVRLRRFSIVLSVLVILVFHHLGGLALVAIASARCIQVRPRAPMRPSLGRQGVAVVP